MSPEELDETPSLVPGKEEEEVEVQAPALSEHEQRRHRGLTHPEAGYFQTDDELYAAAGSFPAAIKLLARSHGLFVGDEEEGHGTLDYPLLLKPAEEGPRTALRSAIVKQCAVLDQATLYLSIKSKGLLEHADCIDATFLCSDRSDFLITLSGCVVEAFQERHQRKGRFGHRHHPAAPVEALWSTSVLKRALSKARRLCVMGNKGHLERATLDIPETEADSVRAAQSSIFSTDGLNRLEVSYDAPWPVSAMYSPQRVSRIGRATRRLLGVGHATVLIRIVWAELRSAGVRANRKGSGEFSPAVMRGLYSAFRAVQAVVQAVEAYSSHRVRIAQERLRRDISLSSGEHGCAGVIEAIDRYTKSLCSGLFVTEYEVHAGQPEPSFEIIGLLVEELLEVSRGVLEKIYGIMSAGTRKAAVEESLESLSSALAEHSRLRTALSRAARYAEESSGLEDAATLSMYL